MAQDYGTLTRPPSERGDWGTLQLTVDISTARTFYIRRQINFLGIDDYTGAVGNAYLQYGDREETRQLIVAGKYWQWPYHRSDVRIIITTAMPGKTLRITIGGAGSIAYPPTVSGTVQIKDEAGAVINPATEETLAAIKAQGANRTSLFSKRITVGTTATQLPTQAIPDGFKVVLYADSANAGEIAYASTSGVAIGTNAGLKAGQGVSLQLDNLNRLYVIASTASQYLHIVVEV